MYKLHEYPLVSVIMIFLNAEKFMQEAIESVLSQSYSNWELIFVDDGSTDTSTTIARSYVQKYPHKMRYCEHAGHKNMGMSASRNLGVRQSSGDYIAFLDADDVYLPQKLERQVALLTAQPEAAMVYGLTQYWYSWAEDVEDQARDQMRTLGVQADRLYHPPILFEKYLLNVARTPGTCSVLIRRQAYEKVGGFEENFSGMLEDQVFFYKLCLQEPVYVESGCWSRYRQHPDSYCQVSRRNGTWDPGHRHPRMRLVFLEWLERYLSQKKVADPHLWDALRKELWSYRHPKLSHFVFTLHKINESFRGRLRSLLSRNA